MIVFLRRGFHSSFSRGRRYGKVAMEGALRRITHRFPFMMVLIIVVPRRSLMGGVRFRFPRTGRKWRLIVVLTLRGVVVLTLGLMYRVPCRILMWRFALFLKSRCRLLISIRFWTLGHRVFGRRWRSLMFVTLFTLRFIRIVLIIILLTCSPTKNTIFGRFGGRTRTLRRGWWNSPRESMTPRFRVW